MFQTDCHMTDATKLFGNDFHCAPVVLLLFNRPDLTRRLLERVRQIKPERLLVVADGPRSSVLTDAAACEEVQRLVRETVDWGARLDWNVADSNMGIRKRVASGLNWAFQLEQQVIVLEDDCLPELSFFPFCTELLDRYQNDTRVGLISGDNFQHGQEFTRASYYFSRYAHIWGWASWRRAWNHYDDSMRDWPELRNSNWLAHLFPHPLEALYWEKLFDEVSQHRIDTWDYAWQFALWTQSQYSILPAQNLISNLGVGESATHTQDADKAKHQLEVSPMKFPLVHPSTVIRNHRADDYSQRTHFGLAKDQSLIGRLVRMGEKARRLPQRAFRGKADS